MDFILAARTGWPAAAKLALERGEALLETRKLLRQMMEATWFNDGDTVRGLTRLRDVVPPDFAREVFAVLDEGT